MVRHTKAARLCRHSRGIPSLSARFSAAVHRSLATSRAVQSTFHPVLPYSFLRKLNGRQPEQSGHLRTRTTFSTGDDHHNDAWSPWKNSSAITSTCTGMISRKTEKHGVQEKQLSFSRSSKLFSLFTYSSATLARSHGPLQERLRFKNFYHRPMCRYQPDHQPTNFLNYPAYFILPTISLYAIG